MRIGINGRFLIAKRTGVQRAAYNLVKTLVSIDRENEYFLFTGHSQIDSPDWKEPNVTVIGSGLTEGDNLRNHFWEQFTLPHLAKKYKVDILHSPANMAPLFYRGKSIVHIHDLCFVVNPQWYSFTFHTVYNLVIPRLARRATRIITNSNNSRNDLLQFCQVQADKVSLIYWAVDDFFINRSHLVSPGEDNQEEDYILYVGSLEPRKNIKTLIEAYEILRTGNPGITTKLVLIGGESPLFADVQLKVRRFKEDVVFKGFVSDATLQEYYARAKVVAYPSLYEGFGLPPLEAMASGAPVVTSHTSSIPEVVGEAALMVNPYDAQQLADVLAKVLQDKKLRQHLRKQGFEQVKRYNWMRVARNVLCVYHEVYHQAKSSHQGDNSFIPFENWQKLVEFESKRQLRPV